MRDDDSLNGFQTGLRFADGRPKPALAAYRLPVWVARAAGGRVRVWGHARPADGATDVEIQRDSGGGFATVVTARTTAAGFLNVRVPAGGRFRLRWTAPDGSAHVSRVTEAARR
jgi:hypothetical protein